jgi:hypothetical protein
MDRPRAVALVKLATSLAAVAALLAFWRSDFDDGFRAVALVAAVVIAGPVALIVAIDAGRVLRQSPLGPAARWVSWLPQVLLGGVACAAGVGGLALLVLGMVREPLFMFFGSLTSLGMIAYGSSLLRNGRSGPDASARSPRSD